MYIDHTLNNVSLYVILCITIFLIGCFFVSKFLLGFLRFTLLYLLSKKALIIHRLPKKKAKKYNKDDLKLRDKKQEKARVQAINEAEDLLIDKDEIVGISIDKKVLGKWTQMVVGKFLRDIKNVNPRDIQDKGLWQAMIIAQRNSEQFAKGRGKDR